MTEKDYLKKYDIKVVILSRGRSDTITTHRLLPDFVEVLVPESEKALYEARIKNPILTTPDDVKGLGKLRNWCIRNFKENTVIMIDDDITVAYCLTGPLSRRVDDPEELMQVIINCAVMAQDMGVRVFGFAQTDIRKYRPTDPFSFNRLVGCIVGVNGKDMLFRDDKFKVDYDFCLKSLMEDRILFQDARYYFGQARENNRGGNAEFRDEEEYNKSLESLIKKWGNVLNVRYHKNQVRISTNVRRRQNIKYE